jgi:hypothetical protein
MLNLRCTTGRRANEIRTSAGADGGCSVNKSRIKAGRAGGRSSSAQQPIYPSHHSPLSTHPVSKMFSSTIVAALSFAALVVATPYDAMAPGTLSSLVRRDASQVLVSCSAPGSSSGSAFPKNCVCPTDLNGDDGVLINFFPVSHHQGCSIDMSLPSVFRATSARTRAAPAPGRTSPARSRTPTRPTARRWRRAPRPAARARSTTTRTRVCSSTSSRATSARTTAAPAPGTASVH